MGERYIQRSRLGAQRYAGGAPVALVAGALLEDTKLQRLVVQLKFENISVRAVNGLQVEICGYDADGSEVERKNYSYENLSAAPGELFGQYAAVALGSMAVERIEVTLSSVVLAGGRVWNAPDAAAASAAEKAVPAAAAAAEPSAIKEETPVAAPAAEKIAPAAAPEAKKSEPAAVVAPAVPKKKKGLGLIIALVLALLVLVAAAVLLVPKLLGGVSIGGLTVGGSGGLSSIGQPALPNYDVFPSEPVNVTTSSDRGSVRIRLEPEEENRYRVTREMLQEVVPAMTTWNSDSGNNLGNDIDDYLVQSYAMMTLVGSDGEDYTDSGYGYIYTNSGVRMLLLFSDPTTLCGYYIGEPEASEDGSCTIEITLCDYDFSALYNECAEDFAASGVMELPCISPEAVSESGASYFYYGYNTSYLNEYGEKQQLYYIWTQMDSPYTDGYIRTMDRYEERLPEGTEEDPRWRYFLLLDKNREPIGYTLACSGIGIAAQEEVATTVWDGGVASGFGGGSGTAKDPYRIESAQQLAYLAKIVNSSENGIGSHFTLEQDIDLNGREWTPIGSDWNFRGTFDGKGHTVRGLKVTGGIERNYDGDRLEIYAGLFGHVGGGTIKNLTVDGEIFIGIPDREGDSSLYVGGIAGNASQGKVINCHNLCDIEAWNIGSEGRLWGGGVVGSSWDVYLDGCSNTGTILTTCGNYSAVGGVIGNAGDGTVQNSWNIGYLEVMGATEDAYSTVGGVVGSANDVAIINCSSISNILGTKRCAGIVGDIYEREVDEYGNGAQVAQLKNCYFAGNVECVETDSWRDETAAITARIDGAVEVENCFFDKNAVVEVAVGGDRGGYVDEMNMIDGVAVYGDTMELLDMLNAWVAANDSDGTCSEWKMDSGIGLPIPAAN